MHKYYLILILFCSSFLTQANTPLDPRDTLNFVHTKSDKKVQMIQGMTIEVYTHDKQKLVGEFQKGSEENIQLKQKSEIKNLAITDIKKIVVYNNVSKDPITGSLRFIVGASSATSLILGGAAAAGGIATVSNKTLAGVGLMAVSVPLIYYGIKLHGLLKNADRSIIKLNKGWNVASPAE